MKALFWILAILSIPVGLFVSIVCWMSNGLGLAGTVIGEVVCIAGIPAVIVSIACMVLGIGKLRKGNGKKAVVFALVGLIYSAVILGGYFLDDAVDTMLMEKDIAERNEQMYGENWDAAPAIEGIPQLYQEVLNEYYAVVRDRWTADQLMGLGACAMADYYGDQPLDNIGFVLMDLNGDGLDEMLIGNAAAEQGKGTEIFCIYTDPENPFYAINSVEGDLHYLYAGEAEGTYDVEIVGLDAAWVIVPAETENTFDFDYREGAMDPAGRLMPELTPFSSYK